KTAHADFLDLAHKRELAVVANDILSTAMQHLTERQLGGQPVFDRRGALVDVAHAIAAELALWGLLSRPRSRRPLLRARAGSLGVAEPPHGQTDDCDLVAGWLITRQDSRCQASP